MGAAARAQGLEADRGRSDQGQRVDVVVPAAAHAPVQAGGGTTGVATEQHAELGAARHPLPDAHPRPDRLVRGAQPVRVVDRHHRLAGHLAGEDHHAGPGGEHRLTVRAREVDPAMPR
ncbi:hypothetical protein GCM10023094_15600 [Rhodococcus olei]|uniref:Uncharacterized protein n=1 Tax=Rhodococcus olei TaxID=2161675 RepID=A0ABP8NWJ7_9NOCA